MTKAIKLNSSEVTYNEEKHRNDYLAFCKSKPENVIEAYETSGYEKEANETISEYIERLSDLDFDDGFSDAACHQVEWEQFYLLNGGKR